MRDAVNAPKLLGSRVVITDNMEASSSVRALDGVDVLFMVSASESKFRRVQHRTFIEADATVGVGQIVYTSIFGAASDSVCTLGRDHADAEAAIRARGMAVMLLRNNFYSDLLPHFADDAGVIGGPAADGRVAAVVSQRSPGRTPQTSPR